MRANIYSGLKQIREAMKAAKRNGNKTAEFEMGVTFASNPRTQKTYTGEEIRAMYPRDRMPIGSFSGASKIVHTYDKDCQHELSFVCIKRALYCAWTGRGNQLLDEIRCWERLSTTDDSDFLCPILRWGCQQGNKVSDTDERQLERVYIVAQKAVKVARMDRACEIAENLNKARGLTGTSASERYDALTSFAYRMNWWDVTGNSGNCGVIYDYEKNCYKAVIIDYAL